MPSRKSLDELLRYLLVAGGMSVVMLVLTRGKWLTALLIGGWLALFVLRFLRRHRKH
ncbi:hypothetical protein [Candidatus Dactylopiibacterium carminicum]|uniref:hypothetical protein n=1 Tax=Candidatus Dactylopiibacterium carminicum TaxID=857335 RepID=UPI0014831E84|nr:hypothetical protein [Candidatus Dactylopiibacterium carminicum]